MLDKAFSELDTVFDCGCGDFMLLTSLMKLGFSEHQIIRNIVNKLSSHSLPDGGFLGLQNVVEAFSALGYDSDGKILLTKRTGT